MHSAILKRRTSCFNIFARELPMTTVSSRPTRKKCYFGCLTRVNIFSTSSNREGWGSALVRSNSMGFFPFHSIGLSNKKLKKMVFLLWAITKSKPRRTCISWKWKFLRSNMFTSTFFEVCACFDYIFLFLCGHSLLEFPDLVRTLHLFAFNVFRMF